MLFIERYAIVPEGKLVGEPVRLADFQEAFFYAIYDAPRRVKRAFLSIARKNAKTATIAMLLLVHLVGPEAVLNSEINSGALSRDQAAQVYKYASKMVDLSPDLRGLVRPVPSSKKLIGLPMNVTYFALSADGKTNHGGSPIVAILDELGQISGPSSDFVDAVETSQGAYEGMAMLIAISTQAPTDADLWSIWLDGAEAAGDPTTVSHLYAAPEDCDLDDERAWRMANPAMGLFRSEEDVRQQAKDAQQMPSKENRFRVLTLNQRVNMISPFVSKTVWKKGDAAPLPFQGRVYGGLDLSATTDLTSLVLTNRRDGVLSVQPHFWMPENRVREASKRDRAPYDVWVREGLIRTTPGSVIDYAYVAKDIAGICAPYDIGAIAFDRWRMDRMQSQFDALGIDLPLEPFGQGYASMSPALDALEEDLLNEIVRHGGNGPLGMCAANAVAVRDPADNRKLDKGKATGRIDGMQALAMAAGVEAKTMEAPLPITPWDSDPSFSLAEA